MLTYWMLLLVPVLGALSPLRLQPASQRIVWLLVWLGFTLVMGLRHEVGGDWFNYLPMFLDTAQRDLATAVSMGDPGYSGLSWIVVAVGGDHYVLHLLCAAVVMAGTVVFCRAQPNPWLALLASVPYMLVVVGMGYTRQSVALGFALIALVALGDGRTRKFVLWVILGALFHKSAVLLLPIAALASSRNRWLTGLLVLASTALMYYLLLEDTAEALWTNYVEADMQSQGGAIRVAMNALPALLLLAFRKRLMPEPGERALWLWLAVFALVCMPLVGLASTAVDRVALYLIPLQLYVFSRLPRLASATPTRTLLVLGIVGYYVAVQFVWLNFATHAQYWVPYRFMPL